MTGDDDEDDDGSGGSGGGVADLFKTRNLRIRTFNVAFNWFSNSLVYYGMMTNTHNYNSLPNGNITMSNNLIAFTGLSLNTGNLPGNPYLILFLMGVAELPGYVTVMVFVDRTGRRCLCSFLMFLGGCACITVAFIPKGIFTLKYLPK